MELIGVRIRLRPFLIQDLNRMVVWNRDQEVQAYVDCDLPDELDELKVWYQTSKGDQCYWIFAIETMEGDLIGDLELDHICWNRREAELRIRIGEKTFWGKGFGSEAIKLILDYMLIFREFHRIYLRVYNFNQRAIYCYRKFGFKPIGILRRNSPGWKNIILMELTKADYQKKVLSPIAG
ncbi:MAG: GNAT family N-acetyltransferase [Firmicutes bacterium]|nr:GNAT family N-acetyltransferase [Bacillota bacterium]